MINSVNTNSVMPWFNTSKSSVSNTKSTSFADTLAANSVNNKCPNVYTSQKIFEWQRDDQRRLTGGVALIGNRHVEYAVYVDFEDFEALWSENASSDNPQFHVMIYDNGKEYEVEFALNDIDPHNASIIEMLALRGYNSAKGLPPVRILRGYESSGNVEDAITDIFAKFDYLKLLLEHMENQRYHGNMKGFGK